MKHAKDFIPWTVTDISIRPYDDMWSMNPSIHFDGEIWRCTLRCTDYAMPNGRTIRSSKARPAGNQTKNAMVIFDPASWRPIKIYKMRERDDHPRTQCANIGYEDMRIFRTDKGGLQGIAASLHLERGLRPADGGAHNQPPEQVLVAFDAEYNIVGARPIRGDWWSGTPQKNWVPFDNCIEPRFLYSISKGTMFDSRGAVHGEDVAVRPSASAQKAPPSVAGIASASAIPVNALLEQEKKTKEKREAETRERELRERAQVTKLTTVARPPIRGSNVAVVRGRRVSHETITSRPSYTLARHGSGRVNSESTRVLGTGRAILPRYEGLRGGTQLVRVADDAWLGIGHEMKFANSLKFYWHTFYLVDSKGRMKAASEPMKLASNGIEFAAGMAIDGDRVVISFGVDDMECKIGETRLSAVMGILKPIER